MDLGDWRPREAKRGRRPQKQHYVEPPREAHPYECSVCECPFSCAETLAMHKELRHGA